MKTVDIQLGSRHLSSPIAPTATPLNIIDRNFVCSAVARYLQQRYVDTEAMSGGVIDRGQWFTPLYDCVAQYVDHDRKRVLVRSTAEGSETYLDYDLLCGCDGARS